MKVLFLPAYYYPETAASSYLGDNLREAICAQGYEIELHAPAPSRGLSADERKKYKKRRLKNEEKNDYCDGTDYGNSGSRMCECSGIGYVT